MSKSKSASAQALEVVLAYARRQGSRARLVWSAPHVGSRPGERNVQRVPVTNPYAGVDAEVAAAWDEGFNGG